MDPTETEAFYIRLGGDIAAMRKQAGLTQVALARLVGMARTSITNIEAGVQRPALHVLAVLCQTLNITLDDMVAGAVEHVDAHAAASGRLQAHRALHQMRLAQRRLLSLHGELGDVAASLAQVTGK